ncbi:MAG: hypothetical protein NT125_09255, partial [Candidatus Bipolaricaulota bacterium]|nr:hypothetical protein [Candidatus Bipolaricaulota bacterium]
MLRRVALALMVLLVCAGLTVAACPCSKSQVVAEPPVAAQAGPSIGTDKADYAPGETVTITGTGWHPGEVIAMLIHQDPERNPDTELRSVADENGTFVNPRFKIPENGCGVTFFLVATGHTSGYVAQTAFTDGCGGPRSIAPNATAVGGSDVNIFYEGQNGSGNLTLSFCGAPNPGGTTTVYVESECGNKSAHFDNTNV